jgi:hypothetical protein
MHSFERFFILEYFKGDPIMNPRMTNGKDPNRVLSRKNVGTIAQKHTNMSPEVEQVARGKANNIVFRGARLQNLLTMYNMTFSPGTKGLGRTHAVLVMSNTPQGPQGVVTRK